MSVKSKMQRTDYPPSFCLQNYYPLCSTRSSRLGSYFAPVGKVCKAPFFAEGNTFPSVGAPRRVRRQKTNECIIVNYIYPLYNKRDKETAFCEKASASSRDAFVNSAERIGKIHLYNKLHLPLFEYIYY